jgi:hypothetical protein
MTEERRDVTTLQEFVLQRLYDLGDQRGPLSIKAAMEKSRGAVSYETLRRITRGLHNGGVSDRVAEGLALALDVSAAEVYRVAGIQRPGSRWAWPAKFDRLNGAQRRLVEEMAAALLEAYDRGRRESSG